MGCLVLDYYERQRPLLRSAESGAARIIALTRVCARGEEQELFLSTEKAAQRDENKCAGSYRFGFNGQMKDDEIAGTGNYVGFNERNYDSRICRWLSIDQYTAKYSYNSPYIFAGNSPVLYREIDGRDYGFYADHINRTITIKAVYYTQIDDATSHASALLATKTWNNQNGKYQYMVGKGGGAVCYDVIFELNVVVVDNPQKEVNADRVPANIAINRITPDGSSNTYTEPV